jgi:hypothetical protein
MLAFDIIFYFLLYLYFDRVMPNEYGVRETPFFCFKKALHFFFGNNSSNS